MQTHQVRMLRHSVKTTKHSPQYTTTFEEEERSSLAETPAREAIPIDRASIFLRKDMIVMEAVEASDYVVKRGLDLITKE